MISAIMRAAIIICLLSTTATLHAQARQDNSRPSPISSKPYKVLTNGKKITVQATSTMSKLMIWTANGHRILEQSRINSNYYSFEVPLKEKIFFVLIEMENGKRFTEKVGVK